MPTDSEFDADLEGSRDARYRENIIEHAVLSQLLEHCWWELGGKRVEVIRPDVDAGGYDLVLEANRRVRHVQLKSRRRRALARRYSHASVRVSHRMLLFLPRLAVTPEQGWSWHLAPAHERFSSPPRKTGAAVGSAIAHLEDGFSWRGALAAAHQRRQETRAERHPWGRGARRVEFKRF